MDGASPASGMRTVALRLDPLDVLFFRDGRPFTEASRGQSGLPWPQTLAGALRTHLLRSAGCDLKAFGELATQLRAGQPLEDAIAAVCGAGWIARTELRGPWLCQQVDGRLEVLVPVPTNLQQLKDHASKDSAKNGGAAAKEPVHKASEGKAERQWARLDPLSADRELPGWQPPVQGMRPLWLEQRVRSERTMAYLRPAGLAAYLAGNTPAADTLVEPEDLYGFDHRTGIVVRPDELTAQKHLIYAISLLALHQGVCFYAEVDLPADAPAEVLGQETLLDFGGEGRKARAQPVGRFEWPDPPPVSEGRVLLLLTTAAVFAERWRPKLPDGTRLVAAAVSGYEAFSGWDLARGGPKPTRFAVPAGSVYFVETPSKQSLSGSLAESDEDRRLGYGCALQGVWNYVKCV